MSSDEMDRFFSLLQEQNRTLTEQGNMLAAIQQSQADTHERLFGGNGTPGIISYLHTEVAEHGKQIRFWKGAIAVLTFLWTAAIAFASAVIGKHR